MDVDRTDQGRSDVAETTAGPMRELHADAGGREQALTELAALKTRSDAELQDAQVKAQAVMAAAQAARSEVAEETRARRAELREQRSDLERREQRLADREERLDGEARRWRRRPSSSTS